MTHQLPLLPSGPWSRCLPQTAHVKGRKCCFSVEKTQRRHAPWIDVEHSYPVVTRPSERWRIQCLSLSSCGDGTKRNWLMIQDKDSWYLPRVARRQKQDRNKHLHAGVVTSPGEMWVICHRPWRHHKRLFSQTICFAQTFWTLSHVGQILHKTLKQIKSSTWIRRRRQKWLQFPHEPECRGSG